MFHAYTRFHNYARVPTRRAAFTECVRVRAAIQVADAGSGQPPFPRQFDKLVGKDFTSRVHVSPLSSPRQRRAHECVYVVFTRDRRCFLYMEILCKCLSRRMFTMRFTQISSPRESDGANENRNCPLLFVSRRRKKLTFAKTLHVDIPILFARNILAADSSLTATHNDDATAGSMKLDRSVKQTKTISTSLSCFHRYTNFGS